MTRPRCVLVNTQVTVSPASRLKVAVESRVGRCVVAADRGQIPAALGELVDRVGAGVEVVAVVLLAVGEGEVRRPGRGSPRGRSRTAALEPLGSVCFSTITLPSSRLLKVQVTVSPAWRLKVAVGLGVAVASSQLIEARDPSRSRRARRPCRCRGRRHRLCGVAVGEWKSGPGVEIRRGARSRTAGSSRWGRSLSSTITVPSARLLKVQVTVSPASTLKVAVEFVPVELASSQLIEVRSQPPRRARRPCRCRGRRHRTSAGRRRG